MLDIFSTENLPIHHKILLDLKDQFDLHKTCTLWLVFLLMFFRTAEQIVILRTEEEEYIVRHFQSNG